MLTSCPASSGAILFIFYQPRISLLSELFPFFN
nr:MAG TPA: hypothetical protein [Caudoviricetes sp.]